MLKLWILHGCVEIGNFSLSIAKYFTSECSKRVKYFATKGVYFHTNANEMPKHFKLFFFCCERGDSLCNYNIGDLFICKVEDNNVFREI